MDLMSKRIVYLDGLYIYFRIFIKVEILMDEFVFKLMKFEV